MICPDTKINEAYQCAERLRLGVAAQRLKVKDSVEIKLTVSIGGVDKKDTTASIVELLNCADKNLYAAKSAGRNRTVVDK